MKHITNVLDSVMHNVASCVSKDISKFLVSQITT